MKPHTSIFTMERLIPLVLTQKYLTKARVGK